jgi:hypothetical protein
MTQQLSPVAQAVLDAFRTSHTGQGCLAVALRAAAENFLMDWDAIQCCDFLLDMADELEAK